MIEFSFLVVLLSLIKLCLSFYNVYGNSNYVYCVLKVKHKKNNGQHLLTDALQYIRLNKCKTKAFDNDESWTPKVRRKYNFRFL